MPQHAGDTLAVCEEAGLGRYFVAARPLAAGELVLQVRVPALRAGAPALSRTCTRAADPGAHTRPGRRQRQRGCSPMPSWTRTARGASDPRLRPPAQSAARSASAQPAPRRGKAVCSSAPSPPRLSLARSLLRSLLRSRSLALSRSPSVVAYAAACVRARRMQGCRDPRSACLHVLVRSNTCRCEYVSDANM